MKLTVPFLWLVVAAGVAQAAVSHSGRDVTDVHARHARLNHRHEVSSELTRRTQRKQKRCKVRPTSSSQADSAPATTTSQAAPKPTTEAAKSSPSPSPVKNSAAKPSSSSAAAKQTSAASTPAQTSGLLKTVFPQCGPNGAIADITPLAGPNGAEEFLNCGVDGAGWTPPPVEISDVVAMDLTQALSDPNSPFKNCQPYVSLFEQYGNQYGVPAIFLASIAMQESSCNPDMTGGAGEQGLMQITKDKCGNAPDGNCKEPWYNIQTGAEFFSGLISGNGGNVLKSIGEYNGWVEGLTIAQATAAATTSCCRCQNNLDYLTQFLNGWLLNRDPTVSPRIGKYFNLDQCQ